MKVSTDARIDALVADLKPVRRLLGPATAAWAGWAAGLLAAGVGLAAIGARQDVAETAGSLGFWFAILAPPAVAWAALRWALELSTPGRSAGGGYALLAGGFGAAWVGSLGSGAAGFGPVGWGACALTETALAAGPLAIGGWLVARRASVRPAATVFALAAAALALGLVALEGHCAAPEWGHRFVQHGVPVVLVPAAVAALAGPWRRRRRPPSR